MLLALLQWNMKNPKNLTFISARGPLTIMASRILGRNTTIPIIFYHDKHCILKLLSLLIDDWMTGGPYAPIHCASVCASVYVCASVSAHACVFICVYVRVCVSAGVRVRARAYY